MTSFEDKAELVTARTATYSWKQSIEDVVVSFDLPSGTRTKDVEVKIETKHLRVKLLASQTILVDVRSAALLLRPVTSAPIPRRASCRRR